MATFDRFARQIGVWRRVGYSSNNNTARFMNPLGERVYVKAGHYGTTTKRVQDVLRAYAGRHDVVYHMGSDAVVSLGAGTSLDYPHAQHGRDWDTYQRAASSD